MALVALVISASILSGCSSSNNSSSRASDGNENTSSGAVIYKGQGKMKTPAYHLEGDYEVKFHGYDACNYWVFQFGLKDNNGYDNRFDMKAPGTKSDYIYSLEPDKYYVSMIPSTDVGNHDASFCRWQVDFTPIK